MDISLESHVYHMHSRLGSHACHSLYMNVNFLFLRLVLMQYLAGVGLISVLGVKSHVYHMDSRPESHAPHMDLI